MAVSVDAGDDTGALWDWFGRDRALLPHLRVEPAAVGAETLGCEYVIVAAITALPVLARSVCGYLAVRTRHRGATLTLRVTGTSGRRAEITVDRATDPAEFARLLLVAADEPDGGGDAPAEA